MENVSLAAPYTPTMLLVGNVSIRYNAAATLTRLRMKNCLELSQCQCRTIGDGRSSTLTCLRMKNRLVVPTPTVEREYTDMENVIIAAHYTPTMLLVGNVSIRYNVAATLTRLRMKNRLELTQCQCRTIGIHVARR